MKDDKLFFFKIAVILVLKQLRALKDVTQANVNTDLSDRFGFSHNMGRNELDANFTLETLFLYCRYFNITEPEFFSLVNNITEEQVLEFLRIRQERRDKRNAKKQGL